MFAQYVKIRYVVEQSVLQKAPRGAIEVLDGVSTASGLVDWTCHSTSQYV